jgi:hypothetical protein
MFHAGQRVTPIKNSKCGSVKSGDVFIVDSISKCKCGVNLHLRGIGQFMTNHCQYCNCDVPVGWKFGASKHFRPLTDLEEQMYWLEKDQHVHVEELEQELCVPINN